MEVYDVHWGAQPSEIYERCQLGNASYSTSKEQISKDHFLSPSDNSNASHLYSCLQQLALGDKELFEREIERERV